MPSRLNYILKKRNNNKRYYTNIKYPEIPLSVNDIYIITTVGDRLDTIANQFLNDVDLWWIITIANQFYDDVELWWVIATANPDIIRRDSFNLKPGIEIRIPQDIEIILEEFEKINE